VGPYIPPGTHAASWRHLHHMKGIQADGGVGAMLLDWNQDPFGAITADVGELGAALLAEPFKEGVHHFPTATLRRPYQPARDVIDDQRQVALASTPADLVEDRFILPLLQVVSGLLSSAGASLQCACGRPPRPQV
jgi:hypothetical protein